MADSAPAPVPVDYDPFAAKAIPVDHDPFASPSLEHRAGAVGTGINRGIASVVGAPVDLITGAINAGSRGVGDLLHATGLVSPEFRAPQISSPIGGSADFNATMGNAGLESFQPQDTLDRYLSAGGEGIGSVWSFSRRLSFTIRR